MHDSVRNLSCDGRILLGHVPKRNPYHLSRLQVTMRENLASHQLAAELAKHGYSAHDLVMASGWMPNVTRDSILESTEDLLEFWNWHGDCAAVNKLRQNRKY